MPQLNKGGKFIFGESVIHPNGLVHLPPQAIEEYRIAAEGMLNFLHLEPGLRLLSIRSSNIAPTLGAKRPLLERAGHFQGEIPLF